MDAAEPEGQLGVPRVREHVPVDIGTKVRWKVGQAGDAREERARHRRRPAMSAEQFGPVIGRRSGCRQEALCLVDEVGGNVGQAIALDTDVE